MRLSKYVFRSQDFHSVLSCVARSQCKRGEIMRRSCCGGESRRRERAAKPYASHINVNFMVLDRIRIAPLFDTTPGKKAYLSDLVAVRHFYALRTIGIEVFW